jgi:NADH-ubiquinone oxidoreductase chain 5
VSCITIFIAGTSAIAETDIKKVIALSTLSQLGVIMSALALGYPLFAFFHLLTHALFKALLFITAGSLINFNYHSQDLRITGNFSSYAPLTLTASFAANLALIGAPFLAGFFSKDIIIELSFNDVYNMLPLILIVVSTITTSIYSIRFLSVVALTSPIHPPLNSISDKLNQLVNPQFIMSIMAVRGGAFIA